jgi:hypothetical protein
LGIGYWLLGIGDWLLVIGDWLLGIGDLQTNSYQFITYKIKHKMAIIA